MAKNLVFVSISVFQYWVLPVHMDAMTYRAQIVPFEQMHPPSWDKWLLGQNTALFQHGYDYAAYMDAGQGRTQGLQIWSGSTLAAQGVSFQYRLGPAVCSVLPAGLCTGPDFDLAALYQSARRAMAQKRLSATVITAPDGILAQAAAMTGGWDAIWHLPAAQDALPRMLKQKWRNRYAKALREGCTVAVSRPKSDAMAWLEAGEIAQRKTKGYRMLPADLPRSLAQHRGRAEAILVTARHSGQYVAAASFICFSDTATYFSGVTTPLGRTVSAQHAVLFAAATHLVKQGIKKINLGLVDTRKAPGLARFKLGTGAIPAARGHSYVQLGRARRDLQIHMRQ